MARHCTARATLNEQFLGVMNYRCRDQLAAVVLHRPPEAVAPQCGPQHGFANRPQSRHQRYKQTDSFKMVGYDMQTYSRTTIQQNPVIWVAHHVCSLPSCSTNSFSSSDSWKRGSAKSTTLFFTLPGKNIRSLASFGM